MRQMEMHLNPLWQRYVPCVILDKGLIYFFFVRKIDYNRCLFPDIPRLHIMNNKIIIKNKNKNRITIDFQLDFIFSFTYIKSIYFTKPDSKFLSQNSIEITIKFYFSHGTCITKNYNQHCCYKFKMIMLFLISLFIFIQLTLQIKHMIWH